MFTFRNFFWAIAIWMKTVTNCVKIGQTQTYLWSVFSCILTEYGPELTPYLDFFTRRQSPTAVSLPNIILRNNKYFGNYLVLVIKSTFGFNNSFQVNVLFLYPQKTSEKLWFSDVFRGYRKGTLAWYRLNKTTE